MKKTALLIVFLILSTFIILGCSSNRANFRDGQFQRGAEMTEEERQQLAIGACLDKDGGILVQSQTQGEK